MSGTGTKAGGAIGLALVVVALAAGASVLFLAPAIVSTASSSGVPTPTPSVSLPAAGGVPVDQNEGADQGAAGGSVIPFVTGAFLSEDGASVTVYTLIPGLIETDGTCRASIVGGSASETAEGPASAEIADTTCAPLVITVAAGPPRDLQVTVEYESPRSSGVSEPAGVTPS